MKNNIDSPTKGPSQIRAFFYLTLYAFFAQTRNPATFVFGFIFPIVFISIFGLIGNSTQTFKVGLSSSSNQNNPIVNVVRRQSFIKVDEDSQNNLENKLKQGKLSGIVSVDYQPNNFPMYKVKVITSSANPQEASTINSFIRGVVDQTNLKLSGIVSKPVDLSQEELSGRKFRYIDFALPGQIGFSLLSTAVFSTTFGFIFLKKALVLKRMSATPTPPITILLSQGASRLIVALLQTLLILTIGVVVFNFYLLHGLVTLLELITLSTFGLIAFLGFGFFVAGLAKDENSGPPLVNLITLPQFLLSGVFFATDNFPKWLQPIANNLPLSYFNLSIRKITTEGGHLSDTIPYLIGLFAWGLVMYILAAKTFKWQ